MAKLHFRCDGYDGAWFVSDTLHFSWLPPDVYETAWFVHHIRHWLVSFYGHCIFVAEHKNIMASLYIMAYVVVQLVEAMRYKPVGHGFASQ